MKKYRKLSEGSDRTEINISPLIDMVFILLIFFIVTTVFVDEAGLDLKRPEPASASNEIPDIVIFRVSDRAEVVHEGKVIGLEGIEPLLQKRLQKKEKLPVVVEVEKGALTGLMVQVMDSARALGIEDISIRNVVHGGKR